MNHNIVSHFLLALLYTCAHGKANDHEKDCTLVLVSENHVDLQIRENQVICVTEGPSYNVYPIKRDENSKKLITLFKSGHLVSNGSVLQLKGGIVYDGDTIILPNEWVDTLPLLENKEIHDPKDIESKSSTKTKTVGDRLKKWTETHNFKDVTVEDRLYEWTQTHVSKDVESEKSINTKTVGNKSVFASPISRLVQTSNSMSTSMSVSDSMSLSFSQSMTSSPPSSAPSVTYLSTPTSSPVENSLVLARACLHLPQVVRLVLHVRAHLR